jgi:hypothetical protein
MTKLISRYSRVAAIAAIAVAFNLAPSLAAKAPGVFNGIVRHVSTDNIKVYDPRSRKTMGFVLPPHFSNVFKKGHSKTEYLATIAPGQYVKVYYDRKLLGAARVRSIYLLDQANRPYSKM